MNNNQAECAACGRMYEAGRHGRPHSGLVSVGPVREFEIHGKRADEQDYECKACEQRWTHETGNYGYGWLRTSEMR